MTNKILFANNAGSQLAVGIGPGDLALSVSAGTGALFPSPGGGGDYFTLTVVDAGTGLLREIMHCTNVTGDVLTVVRAQEGTTARAYVFGDMVANLMTAGQANAWAQLTQLRSASTINASDQLGTVAAVQVYAGNPNTHIAGNAAVVGTSAPSMVWDTTDKIFWVCTTTGNAGAAVWLAENSTAGTTYCGTATGTANALILTPAVPVASLVAGVTLSFIVGTTNSTAATLNVSGTGVKNIYKESPTGPIALTGGEMVAGNLVTTKYDGTQFQLTATELGTAALANASSNTGTVAAVYGTFAANNLATFRGTDGTIQDSGQSLLTINASPLTFANAGNTVQPGTYNVDTTGGAFTIYLSTTLLGFYTFIDAANYWSVNNLTINGNGNNIGAGQTDATAIAGAISTFLADRSDYQFSIEARPLSTYWRAL